MNNALKKHTGGCLCGAVQYEVTGPLRDVVNCHCTMCQRLHGVFGGHSKANKKDIRITKDRGLTWYSSSDIARRGFCRECGSSLFWNPLLQDGIGILAGTLDDSSHLKTIGHIFVAEKAGYCLIEDSVDQFPDSSDGTLEGDYK